MIIKDKRKWRLFSLGLILALSLFACSDETHLQDLHHYLARLKKSLTPHKKTNNILAAIHAPTPVLFQPSKKRDPFESEQASFGGQESNNPLMTFPVSSFDFLGMVVRQGKTWAIIRAPDTKIYELTINNRFGLHYGKIIAIYPDHIEVEEQVSPQETGEVGQGSVKRVVTLRIKGEG